MNPFNDMSSLKATRAGAGADGQVYGKGDVPNPFAVVGGLPQAAVAPWDLGATRFLNATASSAAGSMPFGGALAQSISEGGGVSGARIQRGMPIFDLSQGAGLGAVRGSSGGFGLLPPGSALPAGGAGGTEGDGEYTGMMGEGEVRHGEFLGLAKGGLANFGFIKPAVADAGGDASGNIFVHKSNIKYTKDGGDLQTGQRVTYRLAPHGAPSGRAGMTEGGDASRVQAVEVEVHEESGGNDKAAAPAAGPANAGGLSAISAGTVSSKQWRCTVCMVANDADKSKCVCCEANRPADAPDTQLATGGATTAEASERKLAPATAAHAAEWRCETCMVMNTAKATTCVCCEAARPGGTAALSTAAAPAPPPEAAAAAPSSAAASAAGAAGGFHFPVKMGKQPSAGFAPPAEGAGKGRRRLSPIPEEPDATSPHAKRRGVDEPAERQASLVVRETGAAASDQAAVMPRVLGSPRLLSYSCLVTDLEAATNFLQEVAGMEVCRHEDYHQTLDGGLGFGGRNGRLRFC